MTHPSPARTRDSVASIMFLSGWMTWLASSQALILSGAVPLCGNYAGLGDKALFLASVNLCSFVLNAWYVGLRARTDVVRARKQAWTSVVMVAFLVGIAVSALIPFQVIIAFAVNDRVLVALTYSFVFQPLLQGGLVVFCIRRASLWSSRKSLTILAVCCIALPALWTVVAVMLSHLGCQ